MSITVLDDDTIVREPSADDVQEYAEYLGIDLRKEKHLEWIARDGICAPVPHPWKACAMDNGEELFYFNFETGESIWDHPCDAKYRKMVEEYRKKHNDRRYLPSPAMDTMLENMWCGGIKDDKCTFEEIQSKVEAECNVRSKTCLVPNLFPGFVQKVADYADVTQKDIDNAWLDAAVDVLGRPAIQHSLHDNSVRPIYVRFPFHEDLDIWELAQYAYQRMASVRFDYSTADSPTSGFDIDRYDNEDASLGFLDSFIDVASSSEIPWMISSFSNGPDPRRTIERTSFDEFDRDDLGDVNARNAWLSEPRIFT